MAQRQLGAGLGFTEGPLWTSTGRLLITSVSRGLVYEIDLEGGGLVSSVETGGGPNGLAEDDIGQVWVAQNGGRTMPSRSVRLVRPGLQRIDNDTVQEVIGEGFEAPNDLTVGPDGRIWFTDPGAREAGPGHVYAHDPVTGTTTLVAKDLEYPNGLAFGPDGALVVAETRSHRLIRYTLSKSGLSFDGVLGTLPDGGADGLAFTADGRLLAATPAADLITVFDADGRRLPPLRFDAPTFPTNLCFAGADLDVLVVTAAKGGRVLALYDVGPGLRLPGARPARV